MACCHGDPQKGAIADKNNATDGDILVTWALAEGARRFGNPGVSGGGENRSRKRSARKLSRIFRRPLFWRRARPALLAKTNWTGR